MSAEQKRGVLLVNLGSPDSPSTPDVRKYLNQFLMDARVIDAPYLLRRIIVSGFILPFRPRRSAHAYQAIWWEDGSPLIVISRRVQEALQRQIDYPVALGMRYGNPSIEAGIRELLAQGVGEILLIPLYPHYAMSTYETVVVEALRILKKLKTSIKMEVLPPFYDDPNYIRVLAESAAPHLDDSLEHVLFSYHGVPIRHLKKTDPTGAHCQGNEVCCSTNSPAHAFCYRHQVLQTTAAFAEKVGLPPPNYSVSFQSRLGKDTWLSPFTDREIKRLARSGVRRLAVICPAFVADCLETLEEIGIRGKEIFLNAGGEEFRLIPCLNDHPTWISLLKKWATGELAVHTSTVETFRKQNAHSGM